MLNANDFASKLYDVLSKGVKSNFKNCMGTAIEKFISDSNKKRAQKEQHIVRKEILPERMKDDYKEEKEPVTEEVLLQMAEFKMKYQPHNLTEQDKVLLKQNELWEEPAHV